ncbi:sensor domain-containing diguanylate cyclase [Marinobacter caseinilyticus]|uniref:sensor domain-containing diguanylate cyclase n=1 Tax=Marinobacter caseinilyticus TaxID=2692195 RepID=UPI0014092122|nr:diguanylate cyclase [Marinobacter caseinilyticus]
MERVERCNILLFLLTLIMICNGAVASETNTPCDSLAISSADQRQHLADHLCYFAAPFGSVASNATHPDQLASLAHWQSADGHDLTFTHTLDTYWIQLKVHNPSENAGLWYLKLHYAPLDFVTFWATSGQEDRQIATGDQTPFGSRGINYRYYLLPILLESGQSKTITLKIQSAGALNVPLTLETTEHLIAESNELTLAHGIFYGAVLIFSVFNLLLFFSSGTIYYFYNAFYMVSTGLFLCAMGGFAYQYFWPNSPWFANAAIPLFEALGTLAMTLFGRSFLDINDKRSIAYWALNAIAGVSVVLLALVLVLPYSTTIIINTLFGLIAIGCLFMTGLVRWRQGYGPAKWYVLSWSMMVIGTCVYALAAFGFLADFVAQEILMQGAVGGQVLLLNYAIVQRWRLLNQKLLEVEYDVKHDLEKKVYERTAQLRDTMRDLERANRQLAELSTHDDLTGIHNRRFLDGMLPDICAEARRIGKSAAIVLLDADHFKKVNDSWGHPFGDLCLQRIAEILTRHVRRPRDVVARFGGEEFALVLPNTEEDGATNVASNILHDMAKTTIKTPDGGAISLTLSAGIAVLQTGESDAALFARADEALYRAKAKGRNRFEVATIDQDAEA